MSHALGWATPLQIEVDGVSTTRTNFCVGENVKITCTVASVVNVWLVPDYIPFAYVVAVAMSKIKAPFTLSREEILPNSNIISSLSFAVFSDLDGATITCTDGTAMALEVQTMIATVLGKVMVVSCVYVIW